jgi:hypothetical protein
VEAWKKAPQNAAQTTHILNNKVPIIVSNPKFFVTLFLQNKSIILEQFSSRHGMGCWGK